MFVRAWLLWQCCYALLSWMQMVGVFVSFSIAVPIGTYVVAYRDDEAPEASCRTDDTVEIELRLNWII